MHGFSDLPPPGGDGVHGERRGVVVGADRHPTGVVRDVVHPVGIGLAQDGVDEVVDLDVLGLSGRVPLAAGVPVGPYKLLLLGVHADDGVPGAHVLARLVVEVGELGVPVGVLTALGGLDVRLQAVARSSSSLRTTKSLT